MNECNHREAEVCRFAETKARTTKPDVASFITDLDSSPLPITAPLPPDYRAIHGTLTSLANGMGLDGKGAVTNVGLKRKHLFPFTLLALLPLPEKSMP